MPIYEYECVECGHAFEKFVRVMSQADDVRCDRCDGKVRKKPSVFGVACAAALGSGSSSGCAPAGGG